ncbi:MAG: hypothetical protein IGR93_04845 [Hydrococcus sp. C42_A2020_068]|nr:hypothetical protein Ple7327_2231 [Pleurocapsa sp. PCC 7327]MBF2019447.1 hypothetical protein [Hydrococcus sp. C42_A2020_068]
MGELLKTQPKGLSVEEEEQMLERLFWSAFLTACLWNIVHLSELSQSSSQRSGELLNASDRVSVVASRLHD